MRLCATCALLGLLFVTSVDSGTYETVVKPNMVWTVEGSTELPGAPCDVCTLSGVNDTETSCHSSLTLVPGEEVALRFTCLRPIEESFQLNAASSIDCTKKSCTPPTAEVDSDLFKDFNRTLTWDIGVPHGTVLTLTFPSSGLKELSPADHCQNGHQYTVSSSTRSGEIDTKSYCSGGEVSELDLYGATNVTVKIPKGGELNQEPFSLNVVPRGDRMMSVTPEPKTTIIIKREAQGLDCEVCVKEASRENCNPKQLILKKPQNTTVSFTCPQPQQVFTVEINREMDCTEGDCDEDVVHAETTYFSDFNRTFTWDFKVKFVQTFQLDFPEHGMRQIPNEGTCPDGHTYAVVTYLNGYAVIGTFCKGGPVTSILAPFKGRLSLMVPQGVKLDPVDFKLNVGTQTTMLAVIKVKLPRGVSDTEFIAANYPKDFPDKRQMQWEVTVPGMHNYSVTLRDHTEPECISDQVLLQYQKADNKMTELSLTDPQPQHQQGSFNLTLHNCETNTTLPGLSLKYSISVMRSGHPVLCTVDLSKRKDVSIQIQKVESDPFCEIRANSELKESITVAAGSKASLSFLDCPNDDLLLTASQVIACQNVALCRSESVSLPPLDFNLPMPLHSFTWHLRVPHNGTLELAAPAGGLWHFLPGQNCSQSFSLADDEDDSQLGGFCLNGKIQKIQLHLNVSITAKMLNLKKTDKPFLNVSFIEEIPETIIYSVSPDASAPTLLATPNWPQNMNPSYTVSWIVTLPSQHIARLQFVNISRPKCLDGHANVKVKELDTGKWHLNRREDQEIKDVLAQRSFALNMSSCEPEERYFGIVSEIVLEKKLNLIPIILGLVGALLLLLIILVVVCVIYRKKKSSLQKESSIYIGGGNIFRPNDVHFTKTRSDNDSHIYEPIDESKIYSHLLSDSTYTEVLNGSKGPQVDSYQTFTGPLSGPLPVINEPEPEPYQSFLEPAESFMPPRPRTPIGRQDSLGFQDRRMVENELYTFKNTGEINTIRLSATDLEPEPPIMEDSE